MELISIVDCALCLTLMPEQRVLQAPLPEAWGRLSRVLIKGGWERQDCWSADAGRYASAVDIEEIRSCRACGTHYHYRQDHDPHSGEPQQAETDWVLRRLAITDARAHCAGHADRERVMEALDAGWLAQRYEGIIGLLCRDLARAPDLQIKAYMVESLYQHYVSIRDWEGFRRTLLDCSDPAVAVYSARRFIVSMAPDHPGRGFASAAPYWNNVDAMCAADATRVSHLVAVLAGGLSAHGEMLHSVSDTQEPGPVSLVAMRTLRTDVPRDNLTPALAALAAQLQGTVGSTWWRETARDLLIRYVGTQQARAQQVLAVGIGAGDEASAVRAHCQSCRAQSTD
jgi:hypothetical protein